MCWHMCVCVAGGLSDEISVSGSVQDNLGKSHYKRCTFQSQGHFQGSACAGCLCILLFLHFIM